MIFSIIFLQPLLGYLLLVLEVPLKNNKKIFGIKNIIFFEATSKLLIKRPKKESFLINKLFEKKLLA